MGKPEIAKENIDSRKLEAPAKQSHPKVSARPVQRRMLIPLVVVLVLVVGGFVGALIYSQQEELKQSSKRILGRASNEFTGRLSE